MYEFPEEGFWYPAWTFVDVDLLFQAGRKAVTYVLQMKFVHLRFRMIGIVLTDACVCTGTAGSMH